MPKSTPSKSCLFFVTLFALLLGCDKDSPSPSATQQGNSKATHATIQANAKIYSQLQLQDERDFTDAQRGLIAAPEALTIPGPDDHIIWDMPSYAFIQGTAPKTVNPSLWRQEKLNNIHGLFEVTEGIYQVRGFDLSNMSLIRGQHGWIVVDPLTTKETASAAWAFAQEHLDALPITAVIFTHSHIDHFGGVLGIVAENTDIPVIAPAKFMEEATSENVLAGSTMSRRAMFMYGSQLEHSPRGHVGSGLGKGPAFGSPGIAQPTVSITETGQRLILDGVEFVFQYAPESEAPAELTFYLPEKKAFCGAELVSRNMHNLYTLRGTKVRDAYKWSQYIDEAARLFQEAEVYFASHHWPLWGNEDILDFLKKQRDGYRYIHDQTLRLASKGHTPGEIAEKIQLPETLSSSFANRGYYGTLKHNARAVYQAYFGWYDGNPAHLDPLPREQAAQRYVNLAGGAKRLYKRAKAAYEEGDYRWAAELLNHLVFAEREHKKAKQLLAATYDQLGYQAESGPWRDVYLSAALELRHGPPEAGVGIATAQDMLRKTPINEFFKAMATMIDGEKADGADYLLNITFTDLEETHILHLENAVLHHRQGSPVPEANATIAITHEMFITALTGGAGAGETLFSDDIELTGSKIDLVRFFSLLDGPDETFDIVTP